MYPSESNPTYGIFVKNFKDQMKNEKFDISNTVLIKGRGKNKIDKIVKYINFLRNTVLAVRENEYDMIYVHFIGHSLIPLLFVKKNIQKPLILNAHGSDVFVKSKMGKYIQKLVTPIIKKADLLVVPSNYFKDVIHTKFHIEKNKIFVSPSGGINTKIFRPLNTNKDDKIFTIGYVSRIDEGKGWDVLLRSVKLLNDRGIKNFKVLMIGGGSQIPLLLSMIENLNIDRNIEYVGMVPHNNLIDHYNKMHVFAFTTCLDESLGLVGLEAMACGVPVVGSNIGGLKEYIKNDYNGELFEPDNKEKLSNILYKFMNMQEDILEQYSKNAISTAKEYDANSISNKMKVELISIIEKHKGQL